MLLKLPLEVCCVAEWFVNEKTVQYAFGNHSNTRENYILQLLIQG